MKCLKHIDDWLANLFIATIVVITVIAVSMRYVFNDPFQWVEEVMIALYLWAIMLGAASAMKDRGHVSIDALVSILPERAQRYIQYFNDVVGIIVLITFGWLGLQLAAGASDKITPILGISYRYVDLAVPVGAWLMALYLMGHLIGDVRKSISGEI